MKDFDINTLQMGYIILVQKPESDFFGNQIYKQQRAAGFKEEDAKFAHVVISGGPNRKCDKIYIVNIQPPKVKIRNLIEAFGGRYIKVMKLKEDVDYARIAYFAATLCNKAYDVFGVLRFKFKLLFGMKDLPFCSEGSTWAIRMECPLFFGTKKDSDIMPAHFSESEELETIWEGYLPKEV